MWCQSSGPSFHNFQPGATLNGSHFTPPPSTSCVLSAKWQQIVRCELRLNYLCPQINLSLIPLQLFLSNTNANKLNKSFGEETKCVMSCFQNDFTLPPVQPSVNIEATSLSEAGCEAIRFKRNNLAGPSRLWHNLNAAMTSEPPIFKLRIVEGSHPRCERAR